MAPSLSVYLDHAATTPMHPAAIAAMLPSMQQAYGNPSSIYRLGRDARRAIDDARESVAACLGVRPLDIAFTSGGTESDNAALRGVVRAAQRQTGRRDVHVITSQIEHHAILHTCHDLEADGVQVTYLRVDSCGMVDPASVEAAIHPHTVLVSIMLANNEVGTVQDIAQIAERAHRQDILVHTDAVQVPGVWPLHVESLGVDLLSLSAHKFGGPKGVGVLVIKRGTAWSPIQAGGGQERGRRAGTENVAGIVGLAAALRLAIDGQQRLSSVLRGLRDTLQGELASALPELIIHGHPTQRLPNHLMVSHPDINAESLLLALDQKGIAASSGSACTAGSLDPSHVLMAMGYTRSVARSAVRYTLGHTTTAEEIAYACQEIPAIIRRLLGRT